VPDLETAVRVTPGGTRLLFLLNHGAGPVEVPARTAGVDLLTGARIERAQPIRLEPRGVVVLREDQ
jgi:beta-galactosidase